MGGGEGGRKTREMRKKRNLDGCIYNFQRNKIILFKRIIQTKRI
jgi:hypothetical protein